MRVEPQHQFLPFLGKKSFFHNLLEVISAFATIQLIVLLFGVREISFVGDVCFEQDFNPFQVRAEFHHILPPKCWSNQMLIISFHMT